MEAVAPADPLAADDEVLLVAATVFLESEGLEGANVWRVELVGEDTWWLLCSRKGDVGTVVCSGVEPRDWQLVEWIDGWPL